MPAATAATPDRGVRFTRNTDGTTQAELLLGETVVSFLTIIPLTIAIGVARVAVDGIGGVETAAEHRKQGYSRRVLQATVAHMQQGPAALSLLYGIPDFYPKFGFATAGPEYTLHLLDLARAVVFPDGWTVRPCRREDVPVIRRLYDRYTARAVGAVERAPTGRVWARLDSLVARTHPGETDECRVVISPADTVEGYAWRGKHFWPVTSDYEKAFPESLVIGEVIAASPAAADAVLAVCRAWGATATTANGSAVKDVVLSLAPEGPIYAAALRQCARFTSSTWPAENFMARAMDVGRLLQALQPELSMRLEAAPSPLSGALRLETEIGAATLQLHASGVTVTKTPVSAGDGELTLRLPQTELMRLSLGAFPPGDLLARLDPSADARLRPLIETLFPQRHPYLHLPDRI